MADCRSRASRLHAVPFVDVAGRHRRTKDNRFVPKYILRYSLRFHKHLLSGHREAPGFVFKFLTHGPGTEANNLSASGPSGAANLLSGVGGESFVHPLL